MRTHVGARHDRGLSPGVPTVGAVVVLVASLVTVGLRVPDDPSLAIRGEVPDARTEVTTGPTTSAVPPGRAPAPLPSPTESSTPEVVATPTLEPIASEADDEAAARDALVVPDAEADPAAAVEAAPPAPPAEPPSTPTGPGTGDTPRNRFASRFPAHDAATQDVADPASTRWALLIGVNEHQGTVRDNIGSRQDAESLYAHLMDLGWQPDHVLLLTDGLATREHIVEGIHWLARKTDGDSVAAFSYSGHAKQWPGQDVDGDGEITDEALWPTDNQFIVDGELVQLMDRVTAGRLWLNFMACEAAGFLDPGLVREGRVATFSSAEDEKSYEDPSVGHSVWGWNLIVRGMRHGVADRNGDGEVTVQEAAAHAIPQAAHRTSRQSPHGPQNGGMIDQSGGPFSLLIPDPPPPPPNEDPAPQDDPSPSPEPEPSESPRSCLLVLCSRDD